MAQQSQKPGVPNANEIDPRMMQMIDQITPQNLPMILMSNPELVPQKHLKAMKKAFKNLTTYSIAAIAAGSFLNIMVKKAYIKFLAFPVYTRIPLRLGIFAIPFGLLYGKLNQNMETMGQNLATIHVKLLRFRKTGNIEEYFRP